jgi:predicted transcriptional regulator
MLAKPGDTLEAKVGGKVVDILTSTGDIVEIQTGNFGKIRDKVRLLSQDRRIRIVHPVIGLRIIVQLDAASGAELSRRKSPKRESYYSIFEELIHFPDLFDSGNLQLEVMLVEVEELRTKDGQGSWRRRFQSILDKRLSTHTGTMVFERKQDLLRLLPQKIHNGFTSSELALETGIPMSLAQKMAYVLKKNGLIKEEGRRKRAYVYSVSSEGD